MNIQMAGLCFGVETPSEQLISFYAPYRCEGPPLFTIEVTQGELDAEAVLSSDAPDWEVFGLATYRKICHLVLAYDCLLFHCSAVAVDGRGYLFAAPSGTGKSTHTRLWRERLGNQAIMINDDKPLLRLVDGVWHVCGTPWNGKHRLGSNQQVPIQGICFLEQANHNEIFQMDTPSAIPRLLNQMLRPADVGGMDRLLGLTEDLLARIPLWRMQCIANEAAAVLSYQTMKES